MNLKLISFAVVLCSASQAFAQNATTPVGLGAKANIESLERSGVVKTYDNRYEGTKGSPFMNEEFLSGKIILNNNVSLESVPVKYNVYDNTIVYTDEKNGVLAFGADQVKQLEISDASSGKTLKLKKLEGLAEANQRAANSLVIVLHEGSKANLVALPIKDLVKADYKGSSYSAGRTYDEFFDKKEYYVRSSKGSVEKVKLNKKNLLNVLSDKESEIKSYISKEKIDVSTEEGWVKVLAYYEKL